MVSMNQFERNVQSSFGYVKKDLLMVNDAISDVHEKIQHLSLNHASLLEQIARLTEKVDKLQGKKSAKKAKAKTKKVSRKPVKKVVKETVTYS